MSYVPKVRWDRDRLFIDGKEYEPSYVHFLCGSFETSQISHAECPGKLGIRDCQCPCHMSADWRDVVNTLKKLR